MSYFNNLDLNAASNALALKGFIPDFVKNAFTTVTRWGSHTVSFVVGHARQHPLLSIFAANLALYKLADVSYSAFLGNYLHKDNSSRTPSEIKTWADRAFYVTLAAGGLVVSAVVAPTLKVAATATALAFATVYGKKFALAQYGVLKNSSSES